MLLTAVHRFAGQQGDHLLVTASNEGTEPCWVTSYPAVQHGPLCSVDLKGEKPQFSWKEADVLNWSTEKPYDF